MPVTFSLLASACPAVPSLPVVATIASAAAAAPAIYATTRLGQGAIISSSAVNPGFYANDLLAMAGGSYGGITWGLDLTASVSGLSLQISPGEVNLVGVCEAAAAGTAIIPDNTARVWVWAAQSGRGLVIKPMATSVTPPAGAVALLGSVTSSGGNITGVDYSGRLQAYDNRLTRQTGDAGMPTDTPPATRRLDTITLGGRYLWNGTSYEGPTGATADPTLGVFGLTGWG